MKFISIIFVIMILSPLALCGDATTLSQKFRGMIKNSGSASSLINSIHTFTHSQTVHCTRAQIPNYTGQAKSFNLVSGASTSGRLLRRRGGRGRSFRRSAPRRTCPVRPHRLFGRVAVHHRVSPVFFVRGRGRHFHHFVLPSPFAAWSSLKVDFTPFSDMQNLKFGKNYQNVRFEEHITGAGLSWVKASGAFGKRDGDNITFSVGYGWTFGLITQQYNTISVRVTKKKWFRKRTYTEHRKVPRGLYPTELEQVKQGLEDGLFAKIADKLSGSGARLLSLSSASQRKTPEIDFSKVKNLDNYQKMEGISKEDLKAAIAAMTENAQVSIKKLDKGEFNVWGKTMNHDVKVKEVNGLFDVIVQSRKN